MQLKSYVGIAMRTADSDSLRTRYPPSGRDSVYLNAIKDALTHSTNVEFVREFLNDVTEDSRDEAYAEDAEWMRELIRVLQMWLQTHSAKTVKAKSPAKTKAAKSPAKAKAIPRPSAQLVDAFRRGDDAAIVAGFPSSADNYAPYLETILQLMDTERASLTPVFAGRLFMSLAPIRARLVPVANYEVETDLFTDIRRRL